MGIVGKEAEVFEKNKERLKELRLAIVVSRYNSEIIEGLIAGAQRALQELGIEEESPVYTVPGALEIPLMALNLVESYDAIICLGAVIKGDTAHFDYVCMGVTQGLMQVQLETETCIANGVLTALTHAQAVERSSNNSENKGYEVARVAAEMALLIEL